MPCGVVLHTGVAILCSPVQPWAMQELAMPRRSGPGVDPRPLNETGMLRQHVFLHTTATSTPAWLCTNVHAFFVAPVGKVECKSAVSR
jgi:hypothetical protein